MYFGSNWMVTTIETSLLFFLTKVFFNYHFITIVNASFIYILDLGTVQVQHNPGWLKMSKPKDKNTVTMNKRVSAKPICKGNVIYRLGENMLEWNLKS